MKVTTTRSKLAKIGVLGIVFMFFAGSVIWYFYGGGRDLFFIEDYVPFVELDDKEREISVVSSKLNFNPSPLFPLNMTDSTLMEGFAFATVYVVVDEVVIVEDGYSYFVGKYPLNDGTIGKIKVYMYSNMIPSDFGFTEDWMLKDSNNTLSILDYGIEFPAKDLSGYTSYSEYTRVDTEDVVYVGDAIGVRFMSKYRDFTGDELVQYCEDGSWVCPNMKYTSYFMPNMDQFTKTGDSNDDEYLFPLALQIRLKEQDHVE